MLQHNTVTRAPRSVLSFHALSWQAQGRSHAGGARAAAVGAAETGAAVYSISCSSKRPVPQMRHGVLVPHPSNHWRYPGSSPPVRPSPHSAAVAAMLAAIWPLIR